MRSFYAFCSFCSLIDPIHRSSSFSLTCFFPISHRRPRLEAAHGVPGRVPATRRTTQSHPVRAWVRDSMSFDLRAYLAHNSLLCLFVSSIIVIIDLLIPLYLPFRWFWEVVEDRLDEESRARLLQFTTGGCNVPAQGFKVK